MRRQEKVLRGTTEIQIVPHRAAGPVGPILGHAVPLLCGKAACIFFLLPTGDAMYENGAFS